MDGDKERSGLRFIDTAHRRRLRLFAPEQQSVSVEQVTAVQNALAASQADNPETLETYTIYTELERRRLTIELGVLGAHTELHEAATSYSALMSSAGILPLHGRHEWRIGH